MKDLGLDSYRMSMAWPRLMTEDGRSNERGFDFYKRVLDGLTARGIKAFVTLYHWDLPQWIQDRGGWVSRETAYRFADYADLCSRQLTGRVEAWSTLNEPWCSAWLGHGCGVMAPGYTDAGLAMAAGHHLMLGHGLALPALRANDPKAKLGTVLLLSPGVPLRNTPEDRLAVEYFHAGHNAWFLNPIMGCGYDPKLFQLRGATAPIIPGDEDIIGQKLDYLGVNYYRRTVVTAEPGQLCREIELEGGERNQMGWEIVPDSLYDLMIDLKRRFPQLPPIYITENGMARDDKVENGRVHDPERIRFFERHLAAVDRAMAAGVDIRGYFAWSLLDNFEWAYGYEMRFGLFHVDFQTQKRTAKDSAHWMREFLASRV